MGISTFLRVAARWRSCTQMRSIDSHLGAVAMKRSRSKSLRQLVVTKANLKAIWDLLRRHADADLAKIEEDKEKNFFYDHPRPEIRIESADSLTTEADDPAVFDNDVIDTLKTESIIFSYSIYRPIAKSIRIKLSEGSGLFSPGSFSVSGDNSAWVDATFVELERLFDSVTPQSIWFGKYRGYIRTVVAMCIGYTWGKFMALMAPSSTDPDPAWLKFLHAHPPLLIFVTALMAFIIGIAPASILVDWVSKLWPDIEFDFGPEHLKQQKNVRARLGVVGGLIVLPILLEAFSRFGLGWR